MKVSINDQELLTLSEIQKKVIEDKIESCGAWVESGLRENIANKFDSAFNGLKKEWDDKLAQRGVEMVPTNKDDYASLVFSQPDYKNRSQRDAEAELIRGVPNASIKMD